MSKFYKVSLKDITNLEEFNFTKNGEEYKTKYLYFKIPNLSNILENDENIFLQMADLVIKKTTEYFQNNKHEEEASTKEEIKKEFTEEEKIQSLLSQALGLSYLGINKIDIKKLASTIVKKYVFVDEDLQVPAMMIDDFVSNISLNERMAIYSFLFAMSLTI